MAHVKVGPRFFRSELRVYGSWRVAFARELIQNAIDAGATRLSVTIVRNDDGHVAVRFADDGCGMDRQVLELVFFALGETTKTGSGTIGGYGRARMITCFAQRSYRIRTRELLVVGCGGEYDIGTVDDHQDGCVFDIVTIDDDVEPMVNAFVSLLATCTLDVEVTVNGVRARGRGLPGRARRVLRDEAGSQWGKAYTPASKVAETAQLFVQVRGLTMFASDLDGFGHDVVVALTPERAREVLAASRDRLADPFAVQLDRFRTELSRNNKEAFAPDTTPLRVRVAGGGFLTAGRPPEPATSTPDASGPATQPLGGQVPPARRAAAYTSGNDAAGPAVSGGAVPASPAGSLGFDVVLLADSSGTRVKRLVRAWDPSGWTAGQGRRRRAVLLAWESAVSAAMAALVADRPELGQVSYTVGFSFDPGDRAVCQRTSAGWVLALNPVDEAGRIAVKVSDTDDLRALWATALHEVAHVVVGWHDERYASVLTRLAGTLDQAACVRAMRDAARRA